MKTALIIGHPGHELRAFAFMKKYKPDVYILTDGSGSKNESRLYQSIKIINSLGAKYIDLVKVFKDKDLYDIILNQNLHEFESYRNDLVKVVTENNYDMIVGDALEGFNPTHDICRYLINGIVFGLENPSRQNKILNYDLILDAAPNNVSSNQNQKGLSIELSEEEFEMKYAAAMDYPELKFEVEYAIQEYGKEVFGWESFGFVNNYLEIKNWDSEKPYYEEFGEKRVKEGAYKNIITFENHIKPIAHLCLGLNK